MTKTIFRDGTYYRHVWVGKRTVKQGECAAIWTQSGKRKVIEGPQRVRLWFSHVRFLTRRLADSNEYLRIKFRDGNIQHSRGPCSVFIDPCVHESIEVKPAFKLTPNEVLVVYSEREGSGSGDEGKPLADAASARKPDAPAAAPTTGTTSAAESSSPLVIGQPATVIRRVVHGPAVYVPRACEWVHEFSWHAESRQVSWRWRPVCHRAEPLRVSHGHRRGPACSARSQVPDATVHAGSAVFDDLRRAHQG